MPVTHKFVSNLDLALELQVYISNSLLHVCTGVTTQHLSFHKPQTELFYVSLPLITAQPLIFFIWIEDSFVFLVDLGWKPWSHLWVLFFPHTQSKSCWLCPQNTSGIQPLLTTSTPNTLGWATVLIWIAATASWLIALLLSCTPIISQNDCIKMLRQFM